MHEIVTLQFGKQANYVGTHFWNTQESYFTYSSENESPVDHDIHFRPGIGADGSDTFMPRTLIYDLKDNFGSLRKVNALYEADDDPTPSIWSSSPTIHRHQPIEPHPYQQHLDQGLDPPPLSSSTVRYWSDFSRVYYHPRSLLPVSIHDVPSASTLSSFGDWRTGEELFDTLNKDHDLLDRDARFFTEECDQLQAFQIFADVSDAWGGWTSSWLERLRDEYRKVGIWIWGLEEAVGATREQKLSQLLNNSRSISSISSDSSMYIPVSGKPCRPPHYLSMGSSTWQSSALQAAAIESYTIPSRLRTTDGRRFMLGDMETMINRDGKRTVVELELSVADPSTLSTATLPNGNGQRNTQDGRMTNGVDHNERAESSPERCDILLFDGPADQSSNMATSGRGAHNHVFSRAESFRGQWKSPEEIEEGNIKARDRFENAADSTTVRHQTDLLFPVISSFPHIFDIRGDAGGLAMRAALSTSTGVAQRLRSLAQVVRRSTGVSVDERTSMTEALETMAEEYVEGWDSDMGSDDEDR